MEEVALGEKHIQLGELIAESSKMIDESDEEEEKGQEAVYYDGVNSI